MSQDALELWQEKLAFLHKELALAVGSAKFTLLKEIEEAEQEIARLRARPLPSATSDTLPQPGTRTPPVKQHVFLSYVGENLTAVEALRDDLIRRGEAVWWDRDVAAGGNQRLEIRKALKNAYAFVLCLSEALAVRARSGTFPQIQDAIGIYRELAPGGIFIIPVRLDDCEVPSFEIDSTTMLEDLRFVDLFPASHRSDGMRRLIEALERCPGHP